MRTTLLVLTMTCVGATALCAPVETDEEEVAAQRAWRQSMDVSIAHGDKYLHPEDIRSGKVMGISKEGSFYQRGLEYVSFLLTTKKDVKRANDVLDAFLDTQITDAQDKGGPKGETRYGLFLWSKESNTYTYWFYSPFLGYIALRHQDDLRPEVRDKLMAAIPRMLHYAMKVHPTPLGWTNGYALATAGITLCGAAVGDEQAVQYGERMLDDFAKSVTASGIAEYLSGTYTGVTVGAFERLYAYAPNDRIKKKVAKVLDFLYSDILQQYHLPSGTVIGTQMRATYVEGGSMNDLLYKHFGYYQGKKVETVSFASSAAMFTFNSYPLPPELRKLFSDKLLPLTTRNVHGGGRLQRASYQTKDFGLASESGSDFQMVAGYAGATGATRSSILSCSNLSRTSLSLQEGPRLISYISYAIPEKTNEAWAKEGLFNLPEVRGTLGTLANADKYGFATILQDSTLSELRLNGEDPANRLTADQKKGNTARYIALKAGDLITLKAGRAYFGLRILALELRMRDGAIQATQGELVIHPPMTNSGGRNAMAQVFLPGMRMREYTAAQRVIVGLAACLASTDDYTTLAEFEAALTKELPTATVKNTIHALTWKSKDAVLEYTFDIAAGTGTRIINGKEPGWDFFYDSPILHLKRGESLRGWDNP